MALETAVGIISLAEKLLGDTIANSDEFLTFTGEATVNDAAGHIYYGALPAPANGAEEYTEAEWENYRPFALVYADQFQPLNMQRSASGAYYTVGGLIIVEFEKLTPSGMTDQEVHRHWSNQVGKLIKQTTEPDPFFGITDYADVADRLTINRLAVKAMYRAAPEEEQNRGDYLCAIIECEWGPTS